MTGKLKLKPSQREKKRYLLLGNDEKEKAEKAILDYIGVLGWAKARPVFINKDRKLILAVNRKELDKVKAGLLLDNIKVRKVSGTLKGLER